MSNLAWPVQLVEYQSVLNEIVSRESPSLCREHAGVSLAVYLAKPSRRAWRSTALERIVEHARESYRTLYGPQVPIIDAYDEKSWVYVSVASYESKGVMFDEVLTLRFVPASGAPLRNDDLNLYRHTKNPRSDIAELLGSRGLGAAHVVRSTYSQGRMGAVRPRGRDGTTLSGNHHVGLAWCSMIECFLDDCERDGRACQFLTSQTTEHLRLLGARIPTLPLEEYLGLEPGSIVLDRQVPHVRGLCYDVPTYFLNLNDVARLLEQLIRDGSLSTGAARSATTPGVSLERALRHPHPNTLKRLNQIFASSSKLEGSRISGEDLRQLADRRVADGPVLRLTQLDRLMDELATLRASIRKRPESFIRATLRSSELS